jgi:hypothetical protein
MAKAEGSAPVVECRAFPTGGFGRLRAGAGCGGRETGLKRAMTDSKMEYCTESLLEFLAGRSILDSRLKIVPRRRRGNPKPQIPSKHQIPT